MLSLFLGASFSKWAVNLLVASQLFDFNIEPWGPNEIKKLNTIKALKNNWVNYTLKDLVNNSLQML